jgi:hypothetical protein
MYVATQRKRSNLSSHKHCTSDHLDFLKGLSKNKNVFEKISEIEIKIPYQDC